MATSIDLEMPREVTPIAGWIYPEPIPSAGDRLIYEGTLEFRRQFRLASDAKSNSYALICRVNYQACDRFSCQRPTESIIRALIRTVD